jgi:nucleotide-binding universal stress UspA family protein
MKTAACTIRTSIKNILYATDFSQAAEAALPYAKGLAMQYGATVHGVHMRFPAFCPNVAIMAMPEFESAAQEQSKIEAELLNELLADVPHEVSVCAGEFWSTILDIVRKQSVDLIVIGTRGRTGVEKALLGSMSEEILRSAPCPVLTVGPQISKETNRRLAMKEILYATDFSPESLNAIPYAISLAQKNNAHLTALNVIGQSEPGESIHPRNYIESTLRLLRELAAIETSPLSELNFRMEQGPAAEKILEVAGVLGADLIVLGVRGAAGHMLSTTHLFQPIAHRIVTQAECPVLTVRG